MPSVNCRRGNNLPRVTSRVEVGGFYGRGVRVPDGRTKGVRSRTFGGKHALLLDSSGMGTQISPGVKLTSSMANCSVVHENRPFVVSRAVLLQYYCKPIAR